MEPSAPADQPLVSVVLPTRDRPDMLGDAVRSVCEQTYDRVELIVVDDGSATPASDALDGLSLDPLESVTIIRHGESQGANAARNAGVEAAEGEYVAFLDDDDYWKPSKLARQVRALREAGDRKAVAFVGQELRDADGQVTDVRYPETSGDFTATLARGGTYGTFSTVMVRASAFDRAGRLDEALPRWQDREWYFRLADHYEPVAIREPLVVRRTADGPRISDRHEALRDVVVPRFLEKHRDRVREAGRYTERRFRATLFEGVALSAMRHGRFREGARYLLRSLAQYPLALRPYLYLLVMLGGRPAYRSAQTTRRLLAGRLGDG